MSCCIALPNILVILIMRLILFCLRQWINEFAWILNNLFDLFNFHYFSNNCVVLLSIHSLIISHAPISFFFHLHAKCCQKSYGNFASLREPWELNNWFPCDFWGRWCWARWGGRSCCRIHIESFRKGVFIEGWEGRVNQSRDPKRKNWWYRDMPWLNSERASHKILLLNQRNRS